MTNEALIKLFTSSTRSEKGKNHTGALSFIGNKIYSYNLLIGEYVDRSEEGFIGLLIHDHMATGLGFVSATTSQHVSLLKRVTEYHPRIVRSSDNNLFSK
jgi:hypothetical protein